MNEERFLHSSSFIPHPPSLPNGGHTMKARLKPLLGSITLSGIGAFALAAPPMTPPSPAVPSSTNVVPASGSGILPVPGQGPPGAVAAVGALPPCGPGPALVMPAPAPLVAGKFLLPAGIRVTAFPGSELARMYSGPLVVGFRPGYGFRFELTNLPYQPGKSLFPEIVVQGVLVPRPGMRVVDYPLPLYFSPSDIDRVLKGGMITKVIYLEDPENALPAATLPDFPIETLDTSVKEAIKNANANGRLMAIVRLGDRRPPLQELQTASVNGTLLLPGERYLRAPILPPIYNFFSVPFYDPLAGSKIPREECFPNGGDKNETLGIGPDGQLGGLNASDVGVEFTANGKRRVATSNLICICAPRFLIRRVEEFPNELDIHQVLASNDARMSPATLKEQMTPMTDIAREKANEFAGRTRPSTYIGKVGTSLFIGTSKPVAIGQVQGAKVVGALVEPEVLTSSPSCGPLTVAKMIDPPGPRQSGDIVTITIRYANTGHDAISDLVVSDSLSGRLEYIPGSAQSDRGANFSAAENEAGSAIVRWELPGELFPGQAGTVRFQARVR
jgi:uncharacterized repeat protein (TIGR01451 family)